MQEKIKDFRKKLKQGKDFTWFASFVARRLAAIGTVYVIVFGAFLLLAYAWRTEKKDAEPALNLFHYFNETDFAPTMSFGVQFSIALVLAASCAGWHSEKKIIRLCGTLLVAFLILPPVLLQGDIQTRVLTHFLYAVLLLLTGLIFDRTFGYTRSLARRDFYLARLDAVEGNLNSLCQEDELNKLMEAHAVDRYRDHIGDTFFTLDILKAKALGS